MVSPKQALGCSTGKIPGSGEQGRKEPFETGGPVFEGADNTVPVE